MTNEVRTIAQHLLETVARKHPGEAAAVGSVILVELLAIGLHGGDDVATGEFVGAINGKLVEVAQAHGSSRVWRLVAVDPPTRQ